MPDRPSPLRSMTLPATPRRLHVSVALQGCWIGIRRDGEDRTWIATRLTRRNVTLLYFWLRRYLEAADA